MASSSKSDTGIEPDMRTHTICDDPLATLRVEIRRAGREVHARPLTNAVAWAVGWLAITLAAPGITGLLGAGELFAAPGRVLGLLYSDSDGDVRQFAYEFARELGLPAELTPADMPDGAGAEVSGCGSRTHCG